MTIVAGINGFGRFGLHLLKYWLDRSEDAPFTIAHINDDALTPPDILQVITTDEAVSFNKYKVAHLAGALSVVKPNGLHHRIELTHATKSDIPWLGTPDLFLECSGKNTIASESREFLRGRTRLVLISATSWDADKTLIVGFNTAEIRPDHQVVSYGSCTVNAYVPLAAYVHEKFGILDSDVAVIHNIQPYRLKDANTLNRKFCTLEKSGPNLLPFLGPDNFTVNYTVIPYTGVSMIDFRFRLERLPSKADFIADLRDACARGPLQDLYSFDEKDRGPEVYNCTTFSTVFVEENVRVVGDSVYLQGYFDNENSVNRYFDLACFVSQNTQSALNAPPEGVNAPAAAIRRLRPIGRAAK